MINASRLLRSDEPRAITNLSGEYARHLPECTFTPIVPDFESPVEEPYPYQFGLVGDGFHDDREPLQGDDYAEVVHRFKVLAWNGFLIVLFIGICAALLVVGRG